MPGPGGSDSGVESLYYAVVPDTGDRPVAMFAGIEEAYTWACEQYGSQPFRIRRCAVPAGPRKHLN